MGSAGEFLRYGSQGTAFWVDPQEALVIVYMAQTPGGIRPYYRQLITGGTGRTRPLRVFGPSGTAVMMEHLRQAFGFDIRIRTAGGLSSGDVRSADGVTVRAEDIGPGVVYEADDVRVTAVAVEHGRVAPAFGYRVDYAGRSVVLSGDTTVSDALMETAQDTDLLIHEVIAADMVARQIQVLGNEQINYVIGIHTTPNRPAKFSLGLNHVWLSSPISCQTTPPLTTLLRVCA